MVFPDSGFKASLSSVSLPEANFDKSFEKCTLSKCDKGINPLIPKQSTNKPPLLYSTTIASNVEPVSNASSASFHFLSLSAFLIDKTI